MKRIHLLRHGGDPGALAPLLEAAHREGLRVGWLELAADGPAPVPTGLDAACSAGAFRSVAVGAGRSVALKRQGGPPVLRDLLREHFLGCTLVVVQAGETAGGERTPGPASELVEVAELTAVDGGYRVRAPGEAGRTFDAPDLAARLRRPRPW